MEGVNNYLAGSATEDCIEVNGSTYQAKVRNLKKSYGIDCRKTHKKEFITSELRDGSFGYFFWNRQTGSLDAWIEWE